MTSFIEFTLLRPDLVTAEVGEEGIEAKFPYIIPLSFNIPGDMEIFDRAIAVFDIDVPTFLFEHTWRTTFHLSPEDTQVLLVEGKLPKVKRVSSKRLK